MAKDLMIGIGAEFRGAPAFNKANKTVGVLSRSVRNLAGAFGVAFGARALANYSKAAVKAFAEDDKAARSLSLTLKNLGLAFEDPRVKAFISQMEQQYHVVDDLLRPAFQRLLTVTGSVAQSQALLQSALNASAATGQDLDSVTSILTKAYLGQTKGLTKLGISLTQAQMKAMSFEEILSVINKSFAGQAAQAANTYKGKMDALNVSLSNAQEIIGKGLIDALQNLADDKSLDSITTKITDMATSVADTVRGVSILLDKVSSSPVAKLLKWLVPNGLPIFSDITAAGKMQRIAQEQANTGGGIGGSLSMSERLAATEARKRAAAEEKARKERLKQLAAQKALTKAQQDALKEKKLAAIFDMEQIQIMAALQGKLTDEERKRLELQLAIQQGNVNEAQKLANELANAQGKTSLLATYLRTLPDASNPFKSWGSYLDAIESQVSRIVASTSAISNMPATNSSYAQVGPSGGLGAGVIAGVNPPPVNVNINVSGDGAIADTIRNAINEQASSGKTVGWSQFAVNNGNVAM